MIEYVARTQTTVVDAYLSPIIRRYLNLLQQQFGRQSLIELNVMTSAGWTDRLAELLRQGQHSVRASRRRGGPARIIGRPAAGRNNWSGYGRDQH